MNLNLSISGRKYRGELAAIFARLTAKNQPVPFPATCNAGGSPARNTSFQRQDFSASVSYNARVH
jgi:hypothetical protein